MTKGGSYEARAGSVTWKDVSKETFERFAQFAYTGDYSIPMAEERNMVVKPEKAEVGVLAHPSSPSGPNGIRENSPHGSDRASTIESHDRSGPIFNNELHREPAPDDDPGGILNYPIPPNKKHKKKKKGKGVIKASQPEPELEREPEPDPADPEPIEPDPADPEPVEPEPELADPEPELEPESVSTPLARRENNSEQLSHMLTTDFPSLSYPLLAPRDNYDGTCEPAANFDKDKSYSNVLLSHASLYMLGDSQLIDSLKALALFKLHKTLCAFELDNENIRDITDLARYAYSKKGKGFDEEVGGLRGLVCLYMAIHTVELHFDTRFMNLLAEGGQIVIDFLKVSIALNTLNHGRA